MTATTGAFNIASVSDAYAVSFGAMPSETKYYDPFNAIDVRPELKNLYTEGVRVMQQKALTSTAGGAGTAGYAMTPIYVDPRIVDTTRKYTPLVEMVPRVTNIGRTADFNKVTAKGGAVTAAEDAALSESNDTYDRASTDIKYIYSVGRVTGQARASYPSYILEGFQATGAGLTGTGFTPSSAPNAKQLEVIMKARSMREKEESLIVNGDASTTSTEYSGIVKLMGDTNEVDKNTSALEYDDVETSIQYAFDDGGRPNLAVASSAVLKDLRKIMIDTFHYRPQDMTTTLPFGVSSHLVLETMVGAIPVIPSMYLSNASGSNAIYFMDMSTVEMRVLQDMTYEDLSKTNDSEKFMLKMYEALLIKNPAFCSQINELSEV